MCAPGWVTRYGITAGDFFDEEIYALFPQRRVGGGEVDEITVMADRFRKAQALGLRLPTRDGVGVKGFAFPLLLVFGEDLDRGTP
jgi:hypothetical protein